MWHIIKTKLNQIWKMYSQFCAEFNPEVGACRCIPVVKQNSKQAETSDAPHKNE